MPQYKVYHCQTRDLQFFNIKERRDLKEDYRLVGQVTADDEEDAFAELQHVEGHTWDTFTGDARTTRSLSVGDIIEHDGIYMGVARVGFTRLHLSADRYIEPVDPFVAPPRPKEVAA